jgi:hypothetical protein
VIGLGALALVVIVMVRSCGDDDSGQPSNSAETMPRQAIVVQIPASQWPPAQQAPMQTPAPPQPGYGYLPQPPAQPQQAPAGDGGNPWAVQSQPYSYGQPGYQQWGRQQRPQQQQQRYYDAPPAQYRPLEPQNVQPAPQPAPPPPVQSYYPVAPYDRLSGSSFGTPAYPYGGAYGGAYPGYYGAPGGFYSPGWGGVPAPGWPGVW